MILGHQRVPVFSYVLHYGTGRPLATAANRLVGPLQSHLTGKLVDGRVLRVSVLHRIHHRLAYE